VSGFVVTLSLALRCRLRDVLSMDWREFMVWLRRYLSGDWPVGLMHVGGGKRNRPMDDDAIERACSAYAARFA